MKHYRALRAWCIALTILVTLMLLWLLPSITLGVLTFMGVIACFEGFFLREAFSQAQAQEEQRVRNAGGGTSRRMLDLDRGVDDE